MSKVIIIEIKSIVFLLHVYKIRIIWGEQLYFVTCLNWGIEEA